ncbi:hypothetical protein R1sor_024062 [Riccia sorocarpa]|uniref:Endonuclease/exonuclease/phosphatase domain-containing protein n=1 Tax=Riccia sorocarpa TaxID=122646 RepID=A0ABD3GR97_9MARC
MAELGKWLKESFEKLSVQLEETALLMAEVKEEVKWVKEEVQGLQVEMRSLQTTVASRPEDFESRLDSLYHLISDKQEVVFGKILDHVEGKIEAWADVARGTRESLFKEVSERLDEVQKTCSAAPEKMRVEVDKLDAKAVALEQQAVLLNGALGEQRKMLEETRGSTAQPEMALVMAELDGKIITYADTVRSSQIAALRDQEWEKRAREERCRNIRIVGLSETEGEDSRELILKFFKDDLRVAEPEVEFVSRVGRSDKGDRPILVRFSSLEGRGRVMGNRGLLKGFWNVRGLSEEVIMGGKNLWKEVDIVALAETWEFNGEACVEIPGFERVVTVWNQKRFQRGRGFGGLAVWCRSQLGIKVTVEYADPKIQFICLQLIDGRRGSDLWEANDLVAMVETWCTNDVQLEIPAFSMVTSVWNKKVKNRGRGYGGIAVWVRGGLGIKTTVEAVDTHKQFVCVRVENADQRLGTSFLVFTYFAPPGAAIYGRLGSSDRPFSSLMKLLFNLHCKGPVWLLGDFNSRTNDAQGVALGTLGGPEWRLCEDSWTRCSEDSGHNGHTEYFMQFVSASELTIVNGVRKFSDTNSFTCRTHNGESTVDYLLASKEARDRISEFSFGPFSPESDHRPLICALTGFSKKQRKYSSCVRPKLDESWPKQYEQAISGSLQQVQSSDELIKIVRRVARDTLLVYPRGEQPWFDHNCKEARRKAMVASNQKEAFRSYRLYIRAKKRRFIREKQQSLAIELTKQPWAFWDHFSTRKSTPDLPTEQLYTYIEELYCFPNAEGMANPVGVFLRCGLRGG